MPLLKGSSQNIIAANISELRHAGHPENQAVAIALKSANKHRGAKKVKSVTAKVVKHDSLKVKGI